MREPEQRKGLVMVDHQHLVGKTRRRIALMLGLRAAVSTLSGWLLIWGTLVLVLRTTLGTSRETLLWGLWGIAVSALAGLYVAISRRPSAVVVRAFLDHSWNAGGLLMAAVESGMSGWEISPPDRAIPHIRWAGKRPLLILTSCVLFTVACFFVPARELNQHGPQRLHIAAEVDKFAEKIEILKKEQILPPERAKSLEEALEQLHRDAAGNDPGKTWEAMDHLEQAISQASQEAAGKSVDHGRKAARAEELASALEQARDQMNESSLTAAMSQLAEELRQTIAENELLPEELSSALQDSLETLESESLSKEQLKELSQKLGECKACNTTRLEKLASGRMIDPSRLATLKDQLQIDPESLARLLHDCQGASEVKLCLLGKNPGRGGTSRGQGDATLTWTEGTDRAGMNFKEKALPPGAVASLKDALLQGIIKADPTPLNPVSSKSGGGLDGHHAGRGSARTQVILPEHKQVVQRYFDRDLPRPEKGPSTP